MANIKTYRGFLDCRRKQKLKSTWFPFKEGKTASIVLGVEEVLGIGISGEERRLNAEAWGPYSPEVCKRGVHGGFPGWLPSDFCLMNAISQAGSDLAVKRKHFMNVLWI